MLIGSTNQ